MKVRNYEVTNIGTSVYFCPSCHKQIDVPFKGQVNIQGGLSLACGNCKKGKVIIKLVK